MGLHKFPARPKFTMRPYEIYNRPWQQSAPPANPSLFDSPLFKGKDEPWLKVTPPKFKLIENGLRDTVFILSDSDWFLTASKVELRRQVDELNSRDGIDMEVLGGILEDLGPEQRNQILSWAHEVKKKTDEADLILWNSLLYV